MLLAQKCGLYASDPCMTYTHTHTLPKNPPTFNAKSSYNQKTVDSCQYTPDMTLVKREETFSL